MNNGGGVDGPPPPPPGTGEYLLQLLRRSTPPTHPPFAPHAFFNRYPTNPIPKSETIQTSGTYLNNTSVGEGNINNTTLLSHPPLSLSSNLNHKNSPNRPTLNGNGYEPNYYRNSTDLYGVGGGYNVALNGYETNYQNLPNLNQDFRNLSLNGYETNYQNSQNYNRVGVGYRRASNGYEANYQNSPSLGRGGYNRALNGYQADYRNNRALNRFQNSPNSSRIDEGNSRVSNRSDFHFEKNISRYSKYQGTTSKVVKQPPQGTGKKKSNKNVGQNINKEKGNLNGSRERSVKDKDEREKGGVIGERRLDTQIDSPGLPVENYPSSVSVVEAVEVVEESVSELQSEIGENGENQREFGDDLGDVDGKMSGSLESGKKNRSKNYRLDTRGQTVISQKKRKSSRQLQCRSDVDMLTAPLLAIYDSLIPQEEEKMKQKQLLSLLESIVIKEWPEARLFVYGSCANSFGVRNSDIDICLTIKDVDVLDKSEILWRLADILNEEIFKNVQALTHARVPIVKLMDSTTGISCDICVNNVLAVVNSKLLRDYAKIDDRLRQLAYIVKHWAKSRGVNETYHGTLSSYAYVLMCIHFLQQRRPAVLPCLQEMDSTYSVVVDNVECSFFDQIEKLSGFGSRNRDNIGQLVWGFFRYWAFCHDYVHDVISVRVGSTISKRDKEWNTRIGRDRHLICIEDPFEISHDLGRVVDKRSIKVLREEFERAAEILQFDPNPCVTLFEPYVPN